MMVGIDTVVLSLPIRKFVIMEPSRFTQSAVRVLNAEPKDMGNGRYIDARCNPTKQDTKNFGYLPYLTLYKAVRNGGYITNLRIQFSAPKIIKGNNFDEICQQDFEPICRQVFDGLKHYGIRVYDGIETIKSASVSTIHYSKNISLTNYLSAREAILEIQKCNVSAWKDTCESKYFNNGAGYKTHSKFHELTFYDKVAEYNKGKRNQPTFDKDNQLAFDLFENRQLANPFEILRFEIRLGDTRTLKWALEKAALPSEDLSFKTLFHGNYSKSVLQWHLEELYSNYPRILEANAKNFYAFFSEAYIQNPERSMATIVGAVGLQAILKESGMRALKDAVGTRGSPALARFAKKINKELAYKSEKSEVFEVLQAELERFEPVHLKDYEK